MALSHLHPRQFAEGVCFCYHSAVMGSLYRQYRPQTFAEVVGQNHIKITLQNEIAQGNISHAYLFAGPRGIGKTTTARLLAKAINCSNRKDGESEPCNDCPACRDITTGKSLDVMEIDAASHTGVDNVRENIIENARFSPSQSKYKVFIIDEVHMLSTSAFNALLKVLEEPPAHVVFVLATTELHKIPATIISRCQRFDFRRVPIADITDHLATICQKEKVQCAPDVLAAIAKHSEGYLRDAIGLLGQILSLGETKITREHADLVLPHSHADLVLQFIVAIVHRQAADALRLIDRLMQDGVSLPQFTRDAVELLRQLMVAKITNSLDTAGMEFTHDEQRVLQEIFGQISVDRLVVIIDTLLARSALFKTSPIIQLPLELAAAELCGDSKPDQPPTLPTQPPDQPPSSTPKIETTPVPKPDKTITDAPPPVVLVVKEALKATISVVALEAVQTVWQKVSDELNDSHHSLSLMLRLGKPLSVNDGVVTVGFQFPLHQEIVGNAKNILTVSQTLSSMLGSDVTVSAIVSDQARIEIINQPAPSSLTDIAAMVGGSVVSG